MPKSATIGSLRDVLDSSSSSPPSPSQSHPTWIPRTDASSVSHVGVFNFKDDRFISSDEESECFTDDVGSDDMSFEDPMDAAEPSQSSGEKTYSLLEPDFDEMAFSAVSLQTVTSASRTSSIDYLEPNVRTAIMNGNHLSTKRLRDKNWVGIPPLYHHQSMHTGPLSAYAAHLKKLDGAPMFETIDDHNSSSDEIRRVSVTKRTTRFNRMRRNEYNPENGPSWRPMPAHLVPFVPYIEKPTDATSTSTLRKRTRNMHIGTIESWLQACKSLHGSQCFSDVHLDHIATLLERPLYLIDVENVCLVKAPESGRYVALSYVWGGSDSSASTTKSNFEDLMKPEGLSRSTQSMPRTIIDAMHLVQRLGERYLWVDRYCIIQDDNEGKQSQLAAMGNVYAGAFFTLVAAQNLDASSGIYGTQRKMLLGPTSTSKDRSPRDSRKSCLTGDQIMLDQSIRLMLTKWFSRGWTFQENHFSRRKVIFHGDTVNWECLCASWHEAQDMSVVLTQTRTEVGERSHNPPLVPLTGLDGSSWPDMLRYARLVTLFNERDLTYPEDIFDAFAGCLHRLSSVFPGGFISGIPVLSFDAALLWQPWSPMTRRKATKGSEYDAVLPSWSWAGWAGVLQSESWRSAAHYQFSSTCDKGVDESQQCSWRTISTVKWYYSDNLTSVRQLVAIPPEYAQQNPPSATNDLPQGWHRQAFKGKAAKRFFYFPDPVQPAISLRPIFAPQGPPQPIVKARYLHCTTNRSFLTLGNILPRWPSNCPPIELNTVSGQWAGILRLPCKEVDVDDFLGRQGSSRGRAELIEISAGSVGDREVEDCSFDEWNLDSCPVYNGHYEFINVLWVERRGEVMYRKALGRVEKNAWNRLEKETIDVVLG